MTKIVLIIGGTPYPAKVDYIYDEEYEDYQLIHLMIDGVKADGLLAIEEFYEYVTAKLDEARTHLRRTRLVL